MQLPKDNEKTPRDWRPLRPKFRDELRMTPADLEAMAAAERKRARRAEKLERLARKK